MEMNSLSEHDYLLESVFSMMELQEQIVEAYLSEDEIFDVALEADMVTGNQKRSRINIVHVIQTFFDKVMEMFQNFINKYGKNHARFLAKVEKRFGDINFNNATITMDINYMKAERELKNIRNNPFFRTLTSPNFMNDNNLAQLLSKDKDHNLTMDDFLNSNLCSKYLSKSGSLSEGIKNVFRYVDVDHEQKMVQITGPQLQKTCQQALEYCKGYKSLMRDLKAMKSVAARSLSIMEDKMESMMESVSLYDYSLLEETTFDNTDLNYCIWVTEAEDPRVQQQQQQQREDANTNKPKIETDSQKPPSERQQRKDQMNQDKQNVQNNAQTAEEERNKGRMQLLKFCAQALQIYVSAGLTVAEERYLNYIKVLSHVSRKSNIIDQTKGGTDMVSREKLEQDSAEKTEKKNKKGFFRK